MKRLALVIGVLVIFTGVACASTFRGKSWSGSEFPYVGGLFLHDGDYVRFKTNTTGSYYRVYYMTNGNKVANVELYINGVGQGTTIQLGPNPWNLDHWNWANWAHWDLGSGFINKQIDIRLVENRTVNRKWCGESDLMIKIPNKNDVIKWYHVDSTDWCDLDDVAKW
ncbi:MAG: hypothetical protein NUW23_02155 [Firmicutes bacterium]|nr:hypothetical protein [Bacillota bacterium]